MSRDHILDDNRWLRPGASASSDDDEIDAGRIATRAFKRLHGINDDPRSEPIVYDNSFETEDGRTISIEQARWPFH